MINNSKLKKILITGSHGYIGSVICPKLEELGYTVKGIDNGYFLDCLVNGSIRDLPFTKKHLDEVGVADLEGIDAVIHLSGLQNDPSKSTLPGKVYDIEYAYTKKLADICRKLGIQFIYASSCSVYGTGSDELMDEISLTNPLTAYSQNKLRTEEYLLSIAGAIFNPVMLRFATVYGYSPRMRFDLYINMFVGMALTEKKIKLNSDGMAWRPNLYIGDITKILDAVLNRDFSEPTIINIGNQNSNLRVVDVVEIIKNIENDVITSVMQSEDSSLYSDQYVTSKKDKRSYKIDFSKMNHIFGKDACSTDVKKGIGTLVHNLKTVDNLDNKMKDPHFFRLQWTQKLINKKDIDEQFQWTN